MSERRRYPLIPPHEEVRRRLAENLAETRLLRKQLRVSEDAAIEAENRRRRDVARFNRQDKS